MVKQDNSIYSKQACGGPSLAPLLKYHRWCVAVGPTIDCCLDLLDITYHVG